MPVDKFGDPVIQRGGNVQSEGGIGLSFANDTYLRLDGENDITGNLNMSLNKIENLGEPTNPRDATNKEYVDKKKGTGLIGEVKDETATIKGNLDFKERYRIKNLPDPVDGKDGVNRDFVDLRDKILKTEIENNYAFEFRDAEYQAKEDLNLKENKIKNLPAPTDGKDAVNREYVDEQINLNSAFRLKNGFYYAKTDLLIGKYKLGGLRQPLQDTEAANKFYVDLKVKNLFLDENDNIAFGANVDMEGNQVLNLPEPAEDHEPATKKYVDDLQTQSMDQKGNIKFSRNINLNRNRIFSMRDPTRPSEGANKKYVDETITQRIQEEKDNFLPQDPATKNYVDEAIRGIAAGDVLVSKEGVFIKENGHYRATAPLDIDNQKIENIPDPVDEMDAVNKKYIDGVVENLTLKQGLIRENGGFNLVDSYINMNFNNIRNVGNPKNENDGVPRKFVDDMIKAVEEKIQKERTHLITANASFHEDLIKGKYQFIFGGPNNPTYEKHDVLNGFLMPHSGYIRRFVLENFGILIDRKIPPKFIDTPIPLFTLVLIKSEDINITELGTYNIIFSRDSLGLIKFDYSFISNVGDLKKYQLFKKDIINVRTEYNTYRGPDEIGFFKKGYISGGVRGEKNFVNMVSVLIELDPLNDGGN